MKAQIYGPADSNRQFFAYGNGDDLYTAQPNAVNIFDMLIDETMVGADGTVQIQGGMYWTNGEVEAGDYIEFAVMDLDNVLGYGENVELAKYVRKLPVRADRDGEIDPRQASVLVQGLYLRTIYVAVNAGVARSLRVAFFLAK